MVENSVYNCKTDLNLKEKKKEEIRTFKKYYGDELGNEFKIIDPCIERPDILIKQRNKVVAFELRQYLLTKVDGKIRSYRDIVQKILNSRVDILENLGKRISKEPVENICIGFNNKVQLINEIIKGEKVIEEIKINNNYWLPREGAIINQSTYELTLFEFLNKHDKLIEKGDVIKIKLINRNGDFFYISFRCFTNQKSNVFVTNIFVFPFSENELVEMIVSAIGDKVSKYNEYVEEMKKREITPYKYGLLVYPDYFPTVDVNDGNLYMSILNEMEDFFYDEIIIVQFNKILIIDKDGYKIKIMENTNF